MQNKGDGLIKEFGKELKRSGVISSYTNIPRARIPLLKIVLSTGISMDISFNVADGYCAVRPTKVLIDKYSALRPLVILMKAFLRQRALNNTHSKGIGSFLLVVLITAFLQYQDKVFTKEKNLGELFIDLLTFYGEQFNYREQGISIIGDGTIFYKPERSDFLMVENPQDPDIDLGKVVHEFETIRSNFVIAREILKQKNYSLASILTSTGGKKKLKTYDD